MTQWHPSNDQLIEFASGSISSALSIAVATHLHYCKACQAQVRLAESAASALFDHQTPQTTVSLDFDSLMSKLDSEQVVQQEVNPVKAEPKRFPTVVEKLINGEVENLNWASPMKNLHTTRLMQDENNMIVGLHHMNAGGRVPQHTHRGSEISVVIEGGFSDELGTYAAGDFVHLDGKHNHSPLAHADGDCWLLTIVEAPVKLTGPFGWIINPFLKA